MKLIDTNVLLDNPTILNDSTDITLSLRVLEEIDGLKKNSNPETAFQARRASSFIIKNYDNLKFYMKTNDKISVDNELIEIAKKYQYELLTNDVNIQIKCKMNNIKFSEVMKEQINYSGVKYLYLDFDANGYNKEVDDMLHLKVPPFSMYENEFLVIKDKGQVSRNKNGELETETYCTFRYANSLLELIPEQFIKNKYCGTIKSKNTEQHCLMTLLNNKDINILLAAGTFGVGKSFLLINYALQELEKGRIDRIVYIPNNAFNENTREIGALPGSLYEKELIHMGTLIDIVGSIDTEEMINTGQIELAPISVIRGRNFAKSIIIVNEAQNLTEDHIKLLIARCGENTRIFFDGDIKQADSPIFRNKNGLKLLMHLRNSHIFSKIFGTVKLTSIERSFTAQASAYLDEI